MTRALTKREVERLMESVKGLHRIGLWHVIRQFRAVNISRAARKLEPWDWEYHRTLGYYDRAEVPGCGSAGPSRQISRLLERVERRLERAGLHISDEQFERIATGLARECSGAPHWTMRGVRRLHDPSHSGSEAGLASTKEPVEDPAPAFRGKRGASAKFKRITLAEGRALVARIEGLHELIRNDTWKRLPASNVRAAADVLKRRGELSAATDLHAFADLHERIDFEISRGNAELARLEQEIVAGIGGIEPGQLIPTPEGRQMLLKGRRIDFGDGAESEPCLWCWGNLAMKAGGYSKRSHYFSLPIPKEFR